MCIYIYIYTHRFIQIRKLSLWTNEPAEIEDKLQRPEDGSYNLSPDLSPGVKPRHFLHRFAQRARVSDDVLPG